MKNIKKLKSYGKAVAGSALLVGATLTGAAGLAAAQSGSSGQATLHDYPTPFVDDNGNVDTSIVVGSNGQQADVVSAVDIAGDLGNSAYTTESVSGSAGAVDGEAFDDVTVGTTFGSTIDASDYSRLTRQTVEDDDGNDVFVTESATTTTSIQSRINGTTTDLDVDAGEVSYTVKYSPGFRVNDTITLLGEEYELTSIEDSGDTLKLGSSMDTDVQVGDSFTHGPFTVEVTGRTQGDNPEPVVRVSEGEETLDTQSLAEDEELTVGSDDEFTVKADTVIFYDDGTEDITLKTTYTDTTLENGEDFPLDTDYEIPNSGIDTSAVNSGDGNYKVNSIKVQNKVKTVEDPEDSDETGYVEVDQSFAGPNDYFSVTNQGLSDEAMTDVEFGSDYEVTFTDTNAQEWSVDMREVEESSVTSIGTSEPNIQEGEYFAVTGNDGDNYLVEVTDISSSSVTLAHNEFEKEFTSSDDGTSVSTGYGFSITLTSVGSGSATISNSGDLADTVTTQHGAEISTEVVNEQDGNNDGIPDGADYISVDEAAGVSPDGEATTVYVAYDTETGSDANRDSTDSVGTQTPTTTSTNDYSNSDDGEIGEVTFDTAVPGAGANTRGVVEVTDVDDGDSTLTDFGSGVELDSSSSATVMYPDEQRHQLAAFGAVGEGTGDAVSYMPTGFPSGTATLDSDVSNSERDQNMILVGGPEVNSLTADLASEGETWNSTQYESNQGVGVLDLVNDAFSDGYSALVVAGWQAEDTSAAADYLVNYNSETDSALQGKTTVQVNTDSGQLVQ